MKISKVIKIKVIMGIYDYLVLCFKRKTPFFIQLLFVIGLSNFILWLQHNYLLLASPVKLGCIDSFEFIHSVIYPLTKSLISINLFFAVPFVITLFYFYFRQQRNVSESYLVHNDLSLLKLLFGFILLELMITYGNIFGQNGGNGSSSILYGNLLCLTGLLVWITCFVQFVFNMLKADSLIEKSNKEIKRLENIISILSLFRYKKTEKLFNYDLILRELNWKFEVFYQEIFYIVDKNLNITYKKASIYLIENLIHLQALSDEISESRYSSEYLELYKNILKNHKRLFALLHEKDRGIEEHDILFSMFDFYPGILASIEDDQQFGQVVDEFYCQFWSIALDLSENNRSEFLKFINELMNKVKYPQEKRNICVVLKSLMVKAVEKENLSFLTELCYLQMKFVNHLSSDLQKQQLCTDTIGNVSIELKNVANAMQKKRKDLKKTSKYYQGILTFSLIQAGVKTIELSQYTLTGFLVKYIVTNFNYEEISNAICNVLDKKIYQDEKLNSLELTKLLNVYFSINPKTAVYCMKKLILLIQAQQEFQYNNNNSIISFNILNEYSGDEFYKNDNFTVMYCIEKILSVSDKYGLLALESTRDKS